MEAKKEQKELKHIIKDLRHVETRDAKAHKNVDKLEKALEKNERKEQKLLKELHKATQAYEQAKMNTVHLTEQLQAQRKEAEHVREELKVKKTSVDTIMTEKEQNEQLRLARLQEAKQYGNGSISRQGTVSAHSRSGTVSGHSRPGTMTDAGETVASPVDQHSIRSHGTAPRESMAMPQPEHAQPVDTKVVPGDLPMAQGGTPPPLPSRPID